MISGRLQCSPARMAPVAMMLVVTGLMILLAGVLWPPMRHAGAHGSTGSIDFYRGVMVCVGIAMECLGVVVAAIARALRCARSYRKRACSSGVNRGQAANRPQMW